MYTAPASPLAMSSTRLLQLLVEAGMLAAGAALVGAIVAIVALQVVAACGADSRTMIGVPAVLLAVAICACLVPAYRAARVDPAEILREG